MKAGGGGSVKAYLPWQARQWRSAYLNGGGNVRNGLRRKYQRLAYLINGSVMKEMAKYRRL